MTCTKSHILTAEAGQSNQYQQLNNDSCFSIDDFSLSLSNILLIVKRIGHKMTARTGTLGASFHEYIEVNGMAYSTMVLNVKFC